MKWFPLEWQKGKEFEKKMNSLFVCFKMSDTHFEQHLVKRLGPELFLEEFSYLP